MEGKEKSHKKLFQDREKKFIQALGLLGATNRYISIYNYCDDTDKTMKRLTSVIPEIDAPLLKFMTQVCDPAIRVINPNFTFTGETLPTEDEVNVRKRRRLQEAEDNKQNEQAEQMAQNNQTKGNMTFLQIVLIFIVIALVFAIISMFN